MILVGRASANLSYPAYPAYNTHRIAQKELVNFIFYATLFSHCGIKVVLSAPTHHKQYEAGLSTVMADNICMPAKLMHGHVLSLVKMGVNRIFYPYVVYGKKDDKDSSNSYHCPIVSGYSDVIKSAIDTEGKYGIKFDSPILTFNNPELLHASCLKYLTSLGIDKNTAGGTSIAISSVNTSTPIAAMAWEILCSTYGSK